ncbi:DUF2130 domain-containing protein [Mycobacteroides abscessus]|uniref:DUF2130 domain-containing protein n=1 Tax=Mycobacteroides abscessus TaxID=36809 RepID=UPI00092586F1|nr:DUF2130 domain-containing protein [Mycobacteroides abscessus]SHT55621.1 Uncharacterized protein conserved in bacteria [Mycobacteroides abscessus subsp. abscessus]SHY56750.1 Uncharacterized protein conserved in bacteria [Mycobacteroides abscessus subsp. abscessus]SID53380.1 Uncharacterized protein conserved in bacteria [Mycobacteroides abscessus subsp. abscessus]SIK07543.1 Uncharacterized protein conserved in bacteria [Mycobacteroides abscessus subsp. abscessus]SIM36869.1 Uncharacterized pro
MDLSEAFVRQLAAPLIARATRDQAEQAAEDARAEAAEQIAALKYQMKEQQVGARESDTELRAEIASMASQLKKAHAEEIKLRQEQRELQKQQDNWEVHRERERDSLARTERKRAQQHAKEQIQAERERIEQQFTTRILDLQNQNKTLTKEVETLHRKTTAGPNPQREGVARQHVFAEELRSRWPGDDVQVIARGQRGADIVQTVRDKGRDFGILVSTALPKDIEGSGWIGGILACDFTLATHLADPFRRLLIKTSQYALANAARQGTAEKVYDYITTGGFIPCFGADCQAGQDCLAREQPAPRTRNATHGTLRQGHRRHDWLRPHYDR